MNTAFGLVDIWYEQLYAHVVNKSIHINICISVTEVTSSSQRGGNIKD